MSIPFYILLIIYGLFFLVWFIFSLIGVFHMLRFGFKNFTTWATVFVYVAISLIMLAVTMAYINTVNWRLPIDFSAFFNF